MAQLKSTIITGDLTVTNKINGALNSATVASGDKLPIIDTSDANRIRESNITFSTTSDKCLAEDGTWTKVTRGNTKIFYGVCSTAAATALKEVTCADFTAADLVDGTTIFVKFANTNSASVDDLTMSVNGTTACLMRKIYTGNFAKMTSAAEIRQDAIIGFTCTYHNSTSQYIWQVIGVDYNNTTSLTVYTNTTDYNGDYPLLVSRSNYTTATGGSTYALYANIQENNKHPIFNPSTGNLKLYSTDIGDTPINGTAVPVHIDNTGIVVKNWVVPGTGSPSLVKQTTISADGGLYVGQNSTQTAAAFTVAAGYMSGDNGGYIKVGAAPNGTYEGIINVEYSNNKDKLHFRRADAYIAYVNLTDATFVSSGNDYAEYRASAEARPGYCVQENDNGILTQTNERLVPAAAIISDTYGYAQGETDIAVTPVAVSGRVLAYPYQSIENYHAGMAVCSAPNGKVDIMTRTEIVNYPDCIIGYVSEIPTYETWGPNNVKIDGRIWIRIK